ncbi:hypothetical protein LCGC14_2036570, partial [marine sediment metagenome]
MVEFLQNLLKNLTVHTMNKKEKEIQKALGTLPE